MSSINWHRVKAVMLHSWYHTTHSRETWIDLVWSTTIQFFVFGLLSKLLVPSVGTTADLIIVGFLIWETVRIGQYCITISVMWEVWSKSLSNMFLAPLSMIELMLGYALAGAMKTFGVILALSLISHFWLKVSLFGLGMMGFVILPALFVFSVACGIFITGLILRFGTDIQSLAWGLIYLFQPFSALYYPVEALPGSLQWVAYLSPITYFMTYIRGASPLYVLHGCIVVLVYVVISVLFLDTMSKWSRKTGEFARLGY
jgi:ABC-2 type transport system permease protein